MLRTASLIDIHAIFGIRGIRELKRLEVQVELVDWDAKQKYDRLGIDEMTTEILGEKEYRFAYALNWQELEIELSKELPDLILLDIMLPGVSGFDILKKLKENDVTKEVPVICVTAKSETDDKIYGLSLGAVDYITKPFNINEVRVRVLNHIKDS